ncbi:MAG: hypothetical protein O2962_00450 [Cyanobacteria bacterium]|nr:hypothetical protein [Cyanobacteriota bacterium]
MTLAQLNLQTASTPASNDFDTKVGIAFVEQPIEAVDAKLHQESIKQEPAKLLVKNSWQDFIRNKMPPWAYGISSLWHLATAAMLSKSKAHASKGKAWAANSTRFTKLINSSVYMSLAYEAYKNNFTFDFIGRIAEPIMNTFVDLNHYHLFRGLSSAFNQLHSINLPRVKKGLNLKDNFLANIDVSIEFFKEAWINGGISKLFKGDLSGFKKDLFGGENDRGHTLAIASHAQMLISGLALLNGTKRNLLNRILGIFRNAAGVLADIGLLFEKDPSARGVGVFYLLHAVGDTIKRFVANETQDLIDNMIMPFYNGGLYCFGLMTRRQVDGTYLFNEAKKKPELNSLAV